MDGQGQVGGHEAQGMEFWENKFDEVLEVCYIVRRSGTPASGVRAQIPPHHLGTTMETSQIVAVLLFIVLPVGFVLLMGADMSE